MCQETQGNERREYPVVRAQKLNHEIKKLGSNESGHSYMDQFRMLIAEIGNALGFVRMVRLGGLSYSSLASGYVPWILCQRYTFSGVMCGNYRLCCREYAQFLLASSVRPWTLEQLVVLLAIFSGYLEALFLVGQ